MIENYSSSFKVQISEELTIVINNRAATDKLIEKVETQLKAYKCLITTLDFQAVTVKTNKIWLYFTIYSKDLIEIPAMQKIIETIQQETLEQFKTCS